MTADVPIIDLSNIAEGRATLAKKTHETLTKSGFLYVKGVKGYIPEELLKWTKWFFDLKEDNKLQLGVKSFQPTAKNLYRGYFPVQKETTSYKEGFEIGDPLLHKSRPPAPEVPIFFEENIWPLNIPGVDRSEAEEFQAVMERCYSSLLTAGIELLRLVAEGWGVSEDFFFALFAPDHLSTFRLVHYPPRPPPINGQMSMYEHRDSGFLTLLSTFHYGGLQIRPDGGDWQDVPPLDGALIVNIGQLLASISGGVWKATEHRVVDLGQHRYSVPFFLEPKYDADVNIRLPQQSPQPYGPWLFKRMTQFAEYKDLLNFVDL